MTKSGAEKGGRSRRKRDGGDGAGGGATVGGGAGPGARKGKGKVVWSGRGNKENHPVSTAIVETIRVSREVEMELPSMGALSTTGVETASEKHTECMDNPPLEGN